MHCALAKNLFFTSVIVVVISLLSCSSKTPLIQIVDSSESIVRFQENERYGYKTESGWQVFEAEFSEAPAERLDKIMIVSENKRGQSESYYITRTGEKQSSVDVYMYGKKFDCENEGFIRFKDPETDMVGLLDKSGRIVIPAEYNDLSQVHYGLVRAYKNENIKRVHDSITYSFGYKYYQDHLKGGCNHIKWEGGQKLLLNTNNEVLVENFNYKGRLDYSSLSIEKNASADLTKESFVGKGYFWYIFDNIEMDFERWIENDILKAIDKDLLMRQSMDYIMYADKNEIWTIKSKKDYYDKNANEIIRRVKGLSSEKLEFRVRLIELNPKAYNRAYFSEYYNNCGQTIKDRYPVLEFRRDDYSSEKIETTVMRFLKTDEGYKIIDIRLE